MMQDEQRKGRWEPPPWEADAFDAMKRRREAEEADAEISAAIEDLGEEEAPAPPVPAAAPELAPVKPTVEDARIDAMLIHLKSEEPDATRNAWMLGAVVGVSSGMFGVVLVLWGLVAFARTGKAAAGSLGSAILLLFGIGFIALSAWMLVKALKLKGAR